MNRPAQPYRRLPANLEPKDENASYVPSPEDFEDDHEGENLPVALYSIVERRNLVLCKLCGLLIGEPVTHMLWHKSLGEDIAYLNERVDKPGATIPTRVVTFPTNWTGGDPGGLT